MIRVSELRLTLFFLIRISHDPLLFLRVASIDFTLTTMCVSIGYRRASASKDMRLLHRLLRTTILLRTLHILNLLRNLTINLHIPQLLLRNSKTVNAQISTD